MDGLGLWLSVTTLPGPAVIKAFDAPEPGAVNAIHTTKRVKRNEKFTIFLLFSNCKAAASINCDMTATYSLLTSKNVVLVTQRDLAVWDGPPPRRDKPELGWCVWQDVAFDVEPLGAYRVRCEVKDHVSGKSVVLERPLDLVEGE